MMSRFLSFDALTASSQHLLLYIVIFIQLCAFVEAQYGVEILEPQHMGVRRAVYRCDATGASFGGDIFSFSMGSHAIGCPVEPDPPGACTNETRFPSNVTCDSDVYFAVVPRGGCNFSEKAYMVQRTHPPFKALLVVNTGEGPPVDMSGGKYASEIRIPVLMVAHSCLAAMEEFPPSMGYLIQVKISPGYYDLVRYLIPFVVVVGFCFIVLLVSLILKAIRICRERRKIARKRLSKRNLRKIPTKKFRKGDEPDTCAICLEEFVDGERLRVLPCRHTYHCKCIDPWLTENRKVCPMCKRRVGDRNSDSEDSGDERRRQAAASAATSSTSNFSDSAPPTPDLISWRSVVTVVDEEGPGPSTSSPREASTSQVVAADVHHHHDLSGSREYLVADDETNFITRNPDEDTSDEEVEAGRSLSQSLKQKLKGLFSRSGRELQDPAAGGLVNPACEVDVHPPPRAQSEDGELRGRHSDDDVGRDEDYHDANDLAPISPFEPRERHPATSSRQAASASELQRADAPPQRSKRRRRSVRERNEELARQHQSSMEARSRHDSQTFRDPFNDPPTPNNSVEPGTPATPPDSGEPSASTSGALPASQLRDVL